MGMTGNPALLAAVAIALAGAPSTAHARERLVRHFGVDEQLLPEDVAAMIQDARGFLWFGTSGGILRYDGQQMRPWAKDVVHGTIARLAWADDVLVAVAWDANVFRVEGERASLVVGPDGAPITEAIDAWADPAGRFWLPTRGGVYRSDDRGLTWSRVLADTGAARPREVRVAADGTYYAMTWDALWRIDGDTATKVMSVPQRPDEVNEAFVEMLAMPDGSLVVGTWFGRVHRYRPGETAMVELAKAPGVARALARRGDVIWLAADHALLAIYPDHVETLLGKDDLANHGGPILVDREGSLWVGNGRGAFQFPEPDTASWHENDGISGAGGLRLAATVEGIWVTHWAYQFSRIAPAGTQGPRASVVDDIAFHAVCTDPRGVLWGVRVRLGEKLAEAMSRAPHEPFVHRLDLGELATCGTGRDGVWLQTIGRLWLTQGDAAVPVPAPPFEELALLHESATTLWAVTEGRLCRGRVAALRAGTDDWACEDIALDHVTALVETAAGTLWIASKTRGVARRAPEAPGGVAVIPAGAALPSRGIHVLEPAADGGIWIGGAGFLVRVEERQDLPDGWAVLEAIGPENGIPAFNPIDLVEDAAGTVWATTSGGVLELPRSARRPSLAVVTPTIVAASFDGRRYADGAAVHLAHRENTIELEVASLSYRDPAAIRYRVRIRADAAWTSPARESTIQLVDLPAGDYRVEVQASADGERWVAAPASLAFVVDRPWYLRWSVWALVALATGCVIALGVRVRRGVERRLARQREAIAMDLHDEVASGLGGIGLMAGLSADGAIDEEARRVAAERIAQTARTLGESLSGIVSSLRDEGGTLRGVAADVVERASMLFPNARPRLVVEYPAAWPDLRLDRGVARHLKLIVIEALHNAAKHAAAETVTLAATVSKERVAFRVEDDGRGAVDDGRTGLGLVSMRRRARRIAAELTIEAAPGQRGTTVVVALTPAKRAKRTGRAELRS
jgi:signal transduction histidine kinase/ligand-binding sensor domain-containing protein